MARLTLSYTSKHISPPFEPAPDDQAIVNDVEAVRRNGSSARVEEKTGPLSTQAPPNGIGRYATQITVDAQADSQLEHIASWIKTLGTQDVERYPRVRVDLARNPAKIADVMAVDTQDRLIITGLPSWLPPDDAELIIEGYTEFIGPFKWDLIFNTSPGGVYQSVGRWDTVASVLKTAVNSTATSFDVATTSGPLWTTTAAQFPFDWEIGGERVTVSTIAASLVTFGSVGTAAHADNAQVIPGLPASLAAGNLMLCLAAIRNFGAGVPNTPAGYTRLPVFPAATNVQLFAKIAGSSETAPTVSFTGGVAGATTSAQITRLAGKWHDVNNIIPSGAAATSFNATAAQDITIPGLSKPGADNAIVIRLGWKQDDWTSVTSPGTEIAEPSSILGDDQGIVWSYTIQTAAASVASTTFAVTGGVSAVSRAAIVALRCDFQTATVARSVNGIVKSQVANEPINMWTPLRWGL